MSSVPSLETRLACALAPYQDAKTWYVGFSGGMDSHVLLHALTRLRQHQSIPRVVAIHIHHGLQSVADQWPDHCLAVCAALKVPCVVESVQVAKTSSLEAQAREARYQAWANRLDNTEVLLTAQHQEDQAETLMFRLLRGAGVRGLMAMPAKRPLGSGRLVRPFLQIPHALVRQYAQQNGLCWIEDPSNQDPRMTRNYLRHQVMPALRARWPHVAANMARTAEHMTEAQGLLDELARQDLSCLPEAPSHLRWLPVPSLSWTALCALSEARQKNLLRYWLQPFTPLPDTAHWAGWIDLREASQKASPSWRLAQGTLVRAAQRLWWLSGDWLAPLQSKTIALNPLQSYVALPGNGSCVYQGLTEASVWSVKYRRGGEQLHLDARGHRDLKRLLNEAQIPVFVRSRLPLLFRDAQLWGVFNLPALTPKSLSLIWTPPGLS